MLEGPFTNAGNPSHADEKHRQREYRGDSKASLQSDVIVFLSILLGNDARFRAVSIDDRITGFFDRRPDSIDDIRTGKRDDSCALCCEIDARLDDTVHRRNRAFYATNARRTRHPADSYRVCL